MAPGLRQLNAKLSQSRRQTKGERVPKAQAAKPQAASTQEADKRRKRVTKAQAAKRQLEFHNTPIRLNCSNKYKTPQCPFIS